MSAARDTWHVHVHNDAAVTSVLLHAVRENNYASVGGAAALFSGSVVPISVSLSARRASYKVTLLLGV